MPFLAKIHSQTPQQSPKTIFNKESIKQDGFTSLKSRHNSLLGEALAESQQAYGLDQEMAADLERFKANELLVKKKLI